MTDNESRQASPVARASLPAAVQRWLNRAIDPDLGLPASIRIEQEGMMDTRGRWAPFKATGIYEGSPLSFSWRARLGILPGVWIVAEDGHQGGHGWGRARLWGILPMGQRTDPEVLASQLVRNLGELAWLPPFVLADPSLAWDETGEGSFEVRCSRGGQEGLVRFETDDEGDVVRAASPSRPYDVPGGYAEAPWRYEFSDHQDFDGGRIPATAVATFEKSDGPWEYFRCRIASVTFGTSSP
jgi:hypothetical protein